MKPFAKLFEFDDIGQVVAIAQSNDDGKPEIRFFFDPGHPELTLSSVAMVWADSDAAGQQRDEAFSQLNAEIAADYVCKTITQIKRMLPC